MNRFKTLPRILVVALGIVAASQLWAYPEAARQTKASCVTCHVNPAGGAELSAAGKAFQTEGKAPAAATAKSADYVGAAKCRMCHMKQHKSWLETAHAKAWDGLLKASPEKSAEIAAALKVEIKGSPSATADCVRCHVTGYQLTGGYPQADAEKAAAVMNVTCEACHGPGSLHVAAPMAEKKKFIARATEKMCTQCHTSTTSPEFVFADSVKKGVHTITAK